MLAHLRDEVFYHTNIAYNGGIDFVVAMPNVSPCLDNVDTIKRYAKRKSKIPFAPMSAITIGREGRQLVNVEAIAPYVVGFTDDGNNLDDMKILKDILHIELDGQRAWVMLHCGHEDPYDNWPRVTTETREAQNALQVNRDAGGKLYIQHVSRKATIGAIRAAKRDGVYVMAETCPHYFRLTRDISRVPVNPPIGSAEDREAIMEGIADGTIDIISSDYAPEPKPKVTGIADWDHFRWNCMGLAMGPDGEGIISEERLTDLTYRNPLEVLKTSTGVLSGNIELPENW